MFKSLEFLIDQKVNTEDILKTLVAFGFTQATRVFREGEFSLRGGVIDIYPDHFEVPVRLDIDDDRIVKITGFDPESGSRIEEHTIVVILPYKKSSLPFSSDTPLNNFVDITQGDYVVHNNHGIGRFIGIKSLEADPQKREHLIIEYKDGDKLFVPKHDIHLVQKYVSFAKKDARLNKLGSKEWIATRLSVEKKLRLIAAELLRTQALRAQLRGFAFSKDTTWQKEFEAKFPFKRDS